MRQSIAVRTERSYVVSLLVVSFAFWGFARQCVADERLRVGVFAVDATPPIGSPLAYGRAKDVTAPLSCRGAVLLGEDMPVVLCAVDWIGIGNDGQKEFRESLAEAAGTLAERVAVHALHQHCAPRCDFSEDRLLALYGISDQTFDTAFARDVIRRAAEAVAVATDEAEPVTHLGLGQAVVEKVASNRRILGPDGKVKRMRWTSPRLGELRALPAGTIDPLLRMISLWNDGSPEKRSILAGRVAAGMELAWNTTAKTPISAQDVGWKSVPVSLPPATDLDEASLLARLEDDTASVSDRSSAAGELIWLRRCKRGDAIDVSCLRLGSARVLHMPGELFVEYQLAAQKLRPDLFVSMAAYGDYATAYIGTEIAYSQGGYETRPGVTHVGPQAEAVLMDAIARLLE